MEVSDRSLAVGGRAHTHTYPQVAITRGEQEILEDGLVVHEVESIKDITASLSKGEEKAEGVSH